MRLFRSYAKFKIGKAAFDKGLEYWRKRQRAKAGPAPRSKVKSRR